MANSEARTSNDAAPASGSEYQVFLSFRGPDTRHGFTDFLYNDLSDVGVRVFRDDDELRIGEIISDNLLSAINNSIIYIPIFSQTYASSKWCLWELAHMVDNVSKSVDEKCIFPIFLDVKPDDVKLKTQIYSNALLEHESKFPNEVEAWRAALAEVGKIKGLNVTSSQAAIVKLVVNEVLEKLKIKQKLVTKHLVGLDNRIEELTKLLDVNHNDVRLVGIYGMGGIGKTTIAAAVFNKLCSRFGKCCSFLEGIRERSTKESIVSLQKQLLFDIGGSRIVGDIYNSEDGMRRIGTALKNKKVLVVLDDVDKQELINNLIGNSKLYQGSRIIITTRDASVLEVKGFIGETRQYEMLKMDAGPALQLFGWHAFNGDFPLDDYRRLSSDIVSSTGGLPLAIEVIGSLLNGKHQEIWEEKLEKLRNVPETKILEKLRISYDDLGDHQKQMFLDIACFLFNENKTDAIYMWTDCQFYPKEEIEVLTKRCLIKILDNDKFWMHDQLIALGRQIVRKDSQDDLLKQSRLWIADEALQIIETKKMKDAVQALVISRDDPPIEITNENFEDLPNLRFLELNRGTYVGDFAKCHSNLRWFSWSYYFSLRGLRRDNLDWQFRASNLYLNKLVVCKLDCIYFKEDSKAWDFIKRAQKLKVLSITRCEGITTIPDISKCLALERLTLYDCCNVKRIESFIGDLTRLIDLKIERCNNFTDLPKEVGALVKLKHFSLSECRKLRELPSSLGNLTSLMELNLSDMIIRELPNSIGRLKSLRILRFPLRRFDRQIPRGIDTFVNLEKLDTLVNLEELDLSQHNRMKGEIPIEIGEWSSLRILKLEGTGICRIPRTINKLHHLQTLNLANCDEIQELPELPTSLTHLLLQSTSLLSIPNLSKFTNLVKLVLSGGSTSMVKLPLSDFSNYGKSNLIPGCDLSWIGNLSILKWLELGLLNVLAPPELTSLFHLEVLVLRNLDLKPLMQLPSSDWNLRNLSTLNISGCEGYIPLKGFSQLENLHVKCVRLQRLSIPPELKKLRELRVSSCPKLVEIQILGILKSWENLDIFCCQSLTTISGLSYLKNLSEMRIESCCLLTNVEGLNELESLKFLVVRFCKSLRRLIDASCTKIPYDCSITTSFCGYPIKDIRGMRMKRYREKILSNKISFTIRFQLGVKKSSERFEFVGGIKREKEGFDLYLATYEGLVADVKNFGFCLKRMWYKYPHLLGEIKSDTCVNEMMEDASKKGFLIHLSVEGGVDSEWKGEYDEEMMEMLREERRRKTDVHSDEDEAKWWGLSPSDFDSTPMGGESETHGSTIRFHLGVKKFTDPFERGCIGGIEREKEGVDLDSMTYEGLITEVKNFGFRLKRMWYEAPYDTSFEIKSDWYVKLLLKYVSRERSLIHLLVEGEVDSEWQGEYDDKMMKMLRKQRRMKADVCSDADGAKWGASCRNEDSNSASVGGESETHGSSSVDDFELEQGSAECFEATTLIAEKDSDYVKKQLELHEEPRDEETLTSKCYGEEVFLNSLNKSQDGAEFFISGSNEVPDSVYVGESETDCNSSIDDFRSEPGNTECFEAKGNRRQMRDGRIRRCDSIDGGKTASIKNRKKDKDEIGEPANPSDFVGSSGQTCKGVEHYEKSSKATTEVEDQKDFSSVKRDKNVEIDRVPPKTGRGSGTGCASNPGRDPTERGRGRGRASSSRNGEGLSLGRDAASTLGRATASNSGRDIASSSQSSTTSSLRRERGSTSGKGTTLTPGRGMTLSLGMGRGSSSRTDTTKMGTTSNPRRGITSSSRSSASLSIGRGRGSTLGEGATVSSGKGMTLSLGTGRDSSSRTNTTKMGTSSIPGRGITSSSPSGTSLSTGRGRGSTSGNETTASSRRGKTLSSGRGATKMGTSLRSGTNKGLSSAKAEPQTSRSLEEQ